MILIIDRLTFWGDVKEKGFGDTEHLSANNTSGFQVKQRNCLAFAKSTRILNSISAIHAKLFRNYLCWRIVCGIVTATNRFREGVVQIRPQQLTRVIKVLYQHCE